MADVGDFDFVADLSQCPAIPIPVPALVDTPRSAVSTTGPDFGVDVDAIVDVPLVWDLAQGLRNLGNQIARRLGTPSGSMPDDPAYGFDLRDYVNGGFTPPQIGQIRGGVVAECLKDDRVQAADVDFSWKGSCITVTITVDTADGPFVFVLEVSALTVDLLDGRIAT